MNKNIINELYFSQRSPAALILEPVSSETLVSDVPVKSNSERIVDSLLNGSLVNASNHGYDYRFDSELPQNMNAVDLRTLDITEKLDLFQAINEHTKEHISLKTSERKERLEKQKQELENQKITEFKLLQKKVAEPQKEA